MNHAWRVGLRQRWTAFWFTPGTALNLAAARLIVAAHALWILLSRDLPSLSGIPEALWSQVPVSAQWRYLIWPGHAQLEQVLYSIAISALAFAILGIVPRLACFVAGTLLYHLAPLETLFWTPAPWARGLTISVLALLTLSFSRCGDALCLVSRRTRITTERLATDYTWPLRLLQLFLCQIYLFAGYSKFLRFGWHWVSADTVSGWLVLLNRPTDLFVFTSFGPWIAQYPFLCLGIAVGTVTLELGFISVMIWRSTWLWLVPLVVLFHVGILFTMSIFFLNVPQLLVFVDWQAIQDRWGQKPAA